MPVIGYRPPASGGPDTALLDPDTAIAYVADAPGENGFLYAIGARLGKPDAGTPTADLGIFSTDTSGNPDEAIGHLDPFPVTVSPDGEYQRNLDVAVLMKKHVALAFAVWTGTARLRVDMAGSGYVPGADNTTLYWDDGSELHEDWDTDASSPSEGHLSLWGLYEANVVPDTPANLSPGSSSEATPALLTDTTPTFAGDFRDDNETLPNGLAGDTMKRARVQVYRHDTGALVWDSGALSASSAEIAARRFAITYAGPSLSNGVVYRWRGTVADRFDGWSPVSAWRYFTLGAGRVDTSAATPAGKTNTRTPGPFVATWTHSGGLSTNAVEVKITDAGSGATLRTSATLAMSVLPNGTISVAWATTGFAQLPWDDARLVWWMRGRATDNAWSAWAGQEFWTNDPPKVPVAYSPTAGAVWTTYPVLVVTCTDTDDSGTGITVTFRIMNASGTVLQTRTGTYNASTKRYQYQVVAADFPGYGTYLWDAYAFDGVVYSGGVTSAGSAQTSADRKVVYAQGPTVVITAPATGEIATNTPVITWTATAQVSRRIIVERGPSYAVIHDTGFVATTSRTYTLPAVLSTGEQLHEGDILSITVSVLDGLGLQGGDEINIELDYPTPPALQPAVTLVKGRGDLTPSVVKITWPPSTYPVDEFRYYRLTRTISADMLAANPSLPATPVVFKRLEITQNSYYDWEASSGIEYTYALKQYITAGADTLSSPTRTATVLVQFEATILHAVDDPESKRLVFDARKDRTITAVTDFAVVSPWNQRKPVQFESDVYYHEVDTEWVLAAQTPQDANWDLIRLEAMVRDGAIICYRDGRGNRFYGRFSTPPVVHDPPGGRLRTVRATFRELAYDPSSKD